MYHNQNLPTCNKLYMLSLSPDKNLTCIDALSITNGLEGKLILKCLKCASIQTTKPIIF